MVDDLGNERLSDWAAEVLFRVFNARYISRAPTFVVSNVCPDDVAEAHLRSRFLDNGLCQVVPNGTEDYRQRERQHQHQCQWQRQSKRKRTPVFPNPCPADRRLDAITVHFLLVQMTQTPICGGWVSLNQYK
jgi:hypothetical protein